LVEIPIPTSVGGAVREVSKAFGVEIVEIHCSDNEVMTGWASLPDSFDPDQVFEALSAEERDSRRLAGQRMAERRRILGRQRAMRIVFVGGPAQEVRGLGSNERTHLLELAREWNASDGRPPSPGAGIRLDVGGFEIEAELLEAPSQEGVRRVALRDMGGADGVVFCFKSFITEEGFQVLGRWIVDARESAGSGFVGTIVDTTPVDWGCGYRPTVWGYVARELAESEGMKYVRMDDRSVTAGQVQEMLGEMAARFLFSAD
jgi:hypothetical protein